MHFLGALFDDHAMTTMTVTIMNMTVTMMMMMVTDMMVMVTEHSGQWHKTS